MLIPKTSLIILSVRLPLTFGALRSTGIRITAACLAVIFYFTTAKLQKPIRITNVFKAIFCRPYFAKPLLGVRHALFGYNTFVFFWIRLSKPIKAVNTVDRNAFICIMHKFLGNPGKKKSGVIIFCNVEPCVNWR
jgi:hypothetical protein